ncbi:MAG TPA: hypothetical protein VF261_02515 [Candidatus Saccharimonadales bacterium]
MSTQPDQSDPRRYGVLTDMPELLGEIPQQLSELDAAARLRIAAALGQIADACLVIQDTLTGSPLPEPRKVPALAQVAASQPEGVSAPRGSREPVLPDVLPVPSGGNALEIVPSDPRPGDAPDPTLSTSTSAQDEKLRVRVPETPASETQGVAAVRASEAVVAARGVRSNIAVETQREQRVLWFLRNHPGQQFSPEELRDATGLPSALAFRRAMGRLRERVGGIHGEGNTRCRRYWLAPEPEAGSPSAAPGPGRESGNGDSATPGPDGVPPSPSPAISVVPAKTASLQSPEQGAQIEKQALTDWGLILERRGKAITGVYIGDKSVFMSTEAIAILRVLAGAGGSGLGSRRLRDEASGLLQRDISSAVLKFALEGIRSQFDGQEHSDKLKVTEKAMPNGTTKMTVALRGSLPQRRADPAKRSDPTPPAHDALREPAEDRRLPEQLQTSANGETTRDNPKTQVAPALLNGRVVPAEHVENEMVQDDSDSIGGLKIDKTGLIQLTEWGLGLRNPDNPVVFLHGDPLKLGDLAADALYVLALHPDGIPMSALASEIGRKRHGGPIERYLLDRSLQTAQGILIRQGVRGKLINTISFVQLVSS